MTISLRKVNDEVFVADDTIVRLGAEQASFLKCRAAQSLRRRARICAHRQDDDAVHEMLIALAADSYVHPHRHANKSESFHIVEGRVDVVVLDDMGAVLEIIEMGDISSGRPFYYRLADSLFHTLLIHGDYLVMHEVTSGPFAPGGTILAPFAPSEDRRDEAISYIAELRRAATTHTQLAARIK